MSQEADTLAGTDVRSLRSAFIEVHEELESRFPDYEAHSKEHSCMAEVCVQRAVLLCCSCHL